MKALICSLLTIIMAWTSTLAHSDGRYLLERCEAHWLSPPIPTIAIEDSSTLLEQQDQD